MALQPRPLPFNPLLPEAPVKGTSDAGPGVVGESNSGIGVSGTSTGPAGFVGIPVSDGVLGIGKNGVHGQTLSGEDYGVFGENVADSASGGSGVCGTGKLVYGVYGSSSGDGTLGLPFELPYSGVYGLHTGKTGPGVLGVGTGGVGVQATSFENIGLYATGAKGAASFAGDVTVTGKVTVSVDLILTGGQDCAEHFDIAGPRELEPGTVVVIGDGGALGECHDAYDKKVAGVVSGAGDFRPAIVLGGQTPDNGQALVALFGKVYCKVDAQHAPVEVGDLLTTSPTPGHAMKADDPARAFGAVIGKALRSLKTGRAMIPILVTLQ
jgi:hypothetical protein